jgi:hypothetical protein
MRVKSLVLLPGSCFSLKTALAVDPSSSIAHKAILNPGAFAVPRLVTP